nr:diacylglycerol kinase family lipid kinase [Actinomycetota bacterium]
MSRSVAVIFNPVTGAKDPAGRRGKVEEALEKARMSAVWLETTEEDAGERMLKEALSENDLDMVLVSGGDGTVMACVSALAGTQVPLAVLPGGTGNLLALNLDIPLDLDAAMDVALNGERRRIDVCHTRQGCYAIMARVGFDAAMLRDANPRLKTRIGALAYFFSALKHLRDEAVNYEITLDGQQVASGSAHCILIGNLGRLQGGLEVIPAADPHDGVLDVAVIRAGTIASWFLVVLRVLRGRREGDARVQTFRAKMVKVTTNRVLPVELDGDVFGETDELTVEVMPAALTVCVPSRSQHDRNQGPGVEPGKEPSRRPA